LSFACFRAGLWLTASSRFIEVFSEDRAKVAGCAPFGGYEKLALLWTLPWAWIMQAGIPMGSRRGLTGAAGSCGQPIRSSA